MKPKWNIPLKEKRPVNVPLFCFLDGRYSFLPVFTESISIQSRGQVENGRERGGWGALKIETTTAQIL